MLYKICLSLCIVAASAFQGPAASKLGMSSFVQQAAAAPVRFAGARAAVQMEEVEDKVKAIIAEQLGVEASSVTPTSSFTEDLGADSLDAVELIMAIEEVRPPSADVEAHKSNCASSLLHLAMEAGCLQRREGQRYGTGGAGLQATAP